VTFRKLHALIGMVIVSYLFQFQFVCAIAHTSVVAFVSSLYIKAFIYAHEPVISNTTVTNHQFIAFMAHVSFVVFELSNIRVLIHIHFFHIFKVSLTTPSPTG
jgi:hypothetical protein